MEFHRWQLGLRQNIFNGSPMLFGSIFQSALLIERGIHAEQLQQNQRGQHQGIR